MALSSNSLLTLNDYCLDHIFQYFTLDELMLISGRVDPIIDAAIERQLRRFAHFEFDMRFPPYYGSAKLQALGRHLLSLNINVGYSVPVQNLRNVLEPLCVGAKEGGRLRVLKLQHTYLLDEYINIILPVAPLLQVLDLSRCEVEDHCQFSLLLSAAKNLKTLALYNIDAVNLEQAVLSRLSCLKINWLVGTKLFNVSELAREYPNLELHVYPANNGPKYEPPVGDNGQYLFFS